MGSREQTMPRLTEPGSGLGRLMAWEEAVRREAVIRPLATVPRLGKPAVAAAARRLGRA